MVKYLASFRCKDSAMRKMRGKGVSEGREEGRIIIIMRGIGGSRMGKVIMSYFYN